MVTDHTCAACGDSIDPDDESTVEEINKYGPGPDTRYFCGIGCSLNFASNNRLP